MHYVYLLQSINYPSKYYTGYSTDFEARLVDHNKGKSIYTNKYKPWKMLCCFGFASIVTAKEFEQYLKTGSGRAFLKKHLLK